MSLHARLGFARRRTLVFVTAGWLLAGGLAWNYVFDTMIVKAGRDYVRNQRLYAQMRAPAVTIEHVMGPAQSRALRAASAYGLGVTGLGLGVTVLVAASLAGRRKSRATSPASSPADPR